MTLELAKLGWIAVVLIASASVARADSIGLTDACPPGAHGANSHQGSWCVADECTDSCTEGYEGEPRTCSPMRLCTETHSVFTGSPAAMVFGGEMTTREIEMVVETCARDEACDGAGDRASTAGELRAGSLRCHVVRVCVPAPLPPFATRGAIVPEPEAATEPVPATTPAPTPSAGCGCGVATGSVPWVASALVLLMLLGRRARWALLLALGFVVPLPASAQLPAPWVEHPLPAGFRDLNALACADDGVYARSWQGHFARMQTDGWTALSDVPGQDVGANLTLENGILYTTVSEGIARYADGAWTREDAPLGPTYVDQIAAFDGHAIVPGRGRIVGWNGTTYAAYAGGTWRDLGAAWGTSANDFWVAGARGVAFRFDGRALTPHPIAAEGRVRRLHGLATNDVWAVAEYPSSIHHWDGTRWTDRTSGLEGFSAITVSHDWILAVGSFGVVRWSGDRWQDVHRLEVDPYAMAPFVDVCLTARTIVIGERETTWVRPRTP